VTVADYELLARSPGDEVVQPVTPDAEWLRQAIAWREADLADLRERLGMAGGATVGDMLTESRVAFLEQRHEALREAVEALVEAGLDRGHGWSPDMRAQAERQWAAAVARVRGLLGPVSLRAAAIADANAELVRCAGCDRDVRRDAWVVSAYVCDDCATEGLGFRPLFRAPDVHHGAPRPEPAAKGPPPLCVWDSE